MYISVQHHRDLVNGERQPPGRTAEVPLHIFSLNRKTAPCHTLA